MLDIFFFAFLSVVGEKEENSNTVNVRTRDNKVHGEKTIDQVLEKFAFLAKERIKDSEDEFWIKTMQISLKCAQKSQVELFTWTAEGGEKSVDRGREAGIELC